VKTAHSDTDTEKIEVLSR